MNQDYHLPPSAALPPSSAASPQSLLSAQPFAGDALRLEAVIASVGYDDLLDVTLALNHPHFDTIIVVTTHADRLTQGVGKKYGAIVVQTDLFSKNGRLFNKGAALNAGLSRFQYHGWRQVLDADIAVPDNYRRLLFNHTVLDPECIYGADRVDVIGKAALLASRAHPQHSDSFFVAHRSGNPAGSRYLDPLRGYVPIGYFQLWHAIYQHSYPYSLGTAAHDDVMYAEQWDQAHRRLLPTVICDHLRSVPAGVMGEDWVRRVQPRL